MIVLLTTLLIGLPPRADGKRFPPRVVSSPAGRPHSDPAKVPGVRPSPQSVGGNLYVIYLQSGSGSEEERDLSRSLAGLFAADPRVRFESFPDVALLSFTDEVKTAMRPLPCVLWLDPRGHVRWVTRRPTLPLVRSDLRSLMGD